MTKAKNFDNCIIYKLVCLDTTYPEVYVGSTTCFKQRKYDHKSKSKNDKCKEFKFKVYQYIREHGGFENFAMIEIEKYPCQDSRQLEAREEYWRRELKATLNGQQAFTTEEELKQNMKEYHKNYHETHKDERIHQMKQYYETHKEEIKQQQKNYYETHKDERLQYHKNYHETHKDELKAYMKDYRTTHKEEIKQQKKNYYETHKDKIKQKMKTYHLRKKLEKKSENEIPETIIIEN